MLVPRLLVALVTIGEVCVFTATRRTENGTTGVEEVGRNWTTTSTTTEPPFHPAYKGLLKTQVAEAGFKDRIWQEAMHRQWLSFRPTVHNRLLVTLRSVEVVVTSVSLTLAVLVHKDKDNKASVNSFFYTFLLWDIGLQLCLAYDQWLIYVENMYMYDKGDKHVGRGCSVARNGTLTTEVCPLWPFVFLRLLRPARIFPQSVPHWSDFLVALERCVSLACPTLHFLHFSSPHMPLRRYVIPVFVVAFVLLNQTDHWFGATRLLFSESFSVLNSTHIWHAYDYSAFDAVFGLGTWPNSINEFMSFNAFMLTGFLWVWLLGLLLWRVKQKPNAANAAKNIAAVKMAAIFFAVDAVSNVWKIARYFNEKVYYFQSYARWYASSLSSVEEVSAALSTVALWYDVGMMAMIFRNPYVFNWLLLVALSKGYRTLVLNTARKARRLLSPDRVSPM